MPSATGRGTRRRERLRSNGADAPTAEATSTSPEPTPAEPRPSKAKSRQRPTASSADTTVSSSSTEHSSPSKKTSTDLASLARSINTQLNKDTKTSVDLVHVGKDINLDVPRATTGSVGLDLALGGGWGLNHWHEIVGDFSSGKTALALKTVAANQALDPEWTCVWIAAEEFVPSYARLLGCDLQRMLIVDTNVAEEAYDAALQATESRETDCVIIDSLPALVPTAEEEGDMDMHNPGLMARRTNQFFRKTGKTIKRSLAEQERPVLGIVINQWRMKIGVMWGDPRTTPGGQGKDYGFFTRMEVRRSDWITDSRKLRVGQTVACRVFKNKLAPSERKAEFDFYFDGPRAGEIDRMAELLYIGVEYDIIDKAGGGMYTVPLTGERVKGKEKLFAALEESPEAQQYIFDEALGILHG